jgi:hypothetical protein
MSWVADTRPGHDAIAARDAGLGRIRSVNRAMLLGALALSAALSAVAARSFGGRTLHSGSASSAAASPAQPSVSQAAASPTDPSSGAGGLQSPAQAPDPAASAPAVVSGGS